VGALRSFGGQKKKGRKKLGEQGHRRRERGGPLDLLRFHWKSQIVEVAGKGEGGDEILKNVAKKEGREYSSRSEVMPRRGELIRAKSKNGRLSGKCWRGGEGRELHQKWNE